MKSLITNCNSNDQLLQFLVSIQFVVCWLKALVIVWKNLCTWECG